MKRKKILYLITFFLIILGAIAVGKVLFSSMKPSEKAIANIPEVYIDHLEVNVLDHFQSENSATEVFVLKEDKERYFVFELMKNSNRNIFSLGPPYAECIAVSIQNGDIHCNNGSHSFYWNSNGEPSENWAPKLNFLEYKVVGKTLKYGLGAGT